MGGYERCITLHVPPSGDFALFSVVHMGMWVHYFLADVAFSLSAYRLAIMKCGN